MAGGEFEISYASLDGSLWSEIRFSELALKWQDNAINIDNGNLLINAFPILTGKIDIDHINLGNILFSANGTSDNTEHAAPQTTLSIQDIKLPLRISIDDLAVDNMDLSRQETRQNLFQKLHLKNAHFHNAILFDEFAFQRQNLKLSSQGNIPFNTIDKVDLQIGAHVDLNASLKDVPINVSVSGVFPNIEVKSKVPSPLNIAAETRIDLSNLSSITWNSHISVNDFRLASLIENNAIHIKSSNIDVKGLLKDQQLTNLKVSTTASLSNLTETLKDEMTATLQASLEQRQWHISQLSLEQATRNALLEIKGTIDSDFQFNKDTGINLQVTAKKLQWPENAPILSCDLGNMTVKGTIGNYQFHYLGDLTAAKHVITDMDFSGEGDFEKLKIGQFSANYLNGNWQGVGDLSWMHELNWNAELHGKKADLAILPYSGMTQLHSDLSGTLRHDGGFKNGELYIHVDTPGLSGSINKSKLTAALDFLYQNDSLYFKNIKVKSRGSNIVGDMAFTALTGDTMIDSIWTLNSKDISGFYPGLHGQLSSQGEIRGKLDSPVASLTLNAKNIGNPQINIGSVTSTLRHSTKLSANSILEIKLNQISVFDQKLNSLSIDGSGNPENHLLNAEIAVDNNHHARFSVNGAWKDSNWIATVSDTKVEKDGKLSWLQPDGANLILSANENSLHHYCLTKINAVDRLCIESAKHTQNQSNVSAKIANINLGKLLPYLNKNIHNIEGNLSGDIDLSVDAKLQPSLLTNLFVSNAKIDLASYNPKLPTLNFDRIIAKGKTVSGAFIGTAQAAIPGQGDLKASWNVADLQSVISGKLKSPVEAKLDISLYQLSLIPEFIPDAQSTSGNWENHIQVSGSLDHPKITGVSKLNIDQLTIPRLGIKPKPTSVTLITDNTGKVDFTASTQSGDGKIDIAGTIPTYEEFLDGLQLTAKGSKFQLFNLPESKVVISPDLKVTGSKGTIDLQGTVNVPYGRIKIFDTSNAISLSSDIKIIGEEKQTQVIPLKLTADIKVVLSDDIVIDTNGLKGKLSGALTISERVGKATTAVGELDIKDGIYNAYGRELTIEEGKIIFTSSPLENPSLQIKAVSKNSNDVIAGIKVTGSARNPVVTLFSEPPMDQSNILAYIVLGYPINQASSEEGELLAKAATSIGFLGGEKIIRNLTDQFGLDEVKIRSSNTTKEASLVLGKYLSPKLYVQYAVGIGDTVNSMMLDYKWTNRISIKTESGQTQSTDIIYSFEKD